MALNLKAPSEVATLPTPVSAGQVVPVKAAPPDWITNPKKLALVRDWAARGTDEIEFEAFIALCRHAELDPFRRQVYCMIFNADNKDKRQIAFVVGIDGYRSIAQRSLDHLGRQTYLPMSRKPEFTFSEEAKDPDTNPLGLVEAEVQLHKLINDEPWPIYGSARWAELAPVFYHKSKGKRVLKMGPWVNMPELMLAKCAEVNALRRGWPEQCSGIYADAELEKAQGDETAWEMLKAQEEEARRDKVKISQDEIPVVWETAQEGCATGKYYDRVMAHIEHMSPEQVQAWMQTNRYGLQLYWSKAPGDALELKKALEKATAVQESEEPTGEQDFPSPTKAPAEYALWLIDAIEAAPNAWALKVMWGLHSLHVKDLPHGQKRAAMDAYQAKRKQFEPDGGEDA